MRSSPESSKSSQEPLGKRWAIGTLQHGVCHQHSICARECELQQVWETVRFSWLLATWSLRQQEFSPRVDDREDFSFAPRSFFFSNSPGATTISLRTRMATYDNIRDVRGPTMSPWKFAETRARLNIAATKPWNSNEGGLLPTPDEVHNSTGERNSPWYLMVDCSDNGTVDSIGNSCPYLPSTWLVSQQAQWQLWRRGSTTQQSCTSQQPCPTKWFGFLAGRCEPTKAQARGWDPWRMTTARMAASWTQWPTTCFGPTDCYGQRIYRCVW